MRKGLILAVSASALLAQDPRPAAPIEGTLQLRSGGQLRYTYHFDHNALKDCVRAGSVLIALTDSGNLLRFDATTLKMTGQQIVPGRATAISQGGNGRVLVGTLDGRVSEVDPSTLAAEPVFEGPGRIVWLGIGMAPGGRARMIVAAVDGRADVLPWPGEPDKQFDLRSARLETTQGRGFSLVTYSNGGTKRFPLPLTSFATPSSFLLDGPTRLWAGTDKGEWGGEYSRFDLRTGNVHSVRTDQGILGFLRSADGRVLAYGGMSHLGSDEGFICRIDRGHQEYLRQFANTAPQAPVPEVFQRALDLLHKDRAGDVHRPDDLPYGPIDFVAEDPAGKGFWVLSAHTLYHASADFSGWTKEAALGGRWFGGRAYSMGNTPSVHSLIVDRPPELIAVMERDGLARISPANSQLVALDGQIESEIIEVWNTSMGTIFLTADEVHSGWRLTSDRWHALGFCPNRTPLDGDPTWYFAEPLANSAAGIVALCGANVDPGPRALTRTDAQGVTETLNSWSDSSGPWPGGFLSTSDGRVFKAEEDELEVLGGDGWRHAGRHIGPSSRGRRSVFSGRRYLPLGAAAGTEYFLDVDLGDLVQLSGAGRTLELAPLASARRKPLDGVFDAVPDGQGWILVAATSGLFRFHLEDGDLARIPSPSPNEELKSLSRDSQGRLWAAGDRLYLSSGEGRRWETVGLPMLSHTYSKRIRANPADAQGIILSLFDQGVVFVSMADPRPTARNTR